jgi:hypothetical protein
LFAADVEDGMNTDLLSRLRAYAAANPTDVATVCETVRWSNAEERRERAKPMAAATPTLRGFAMPVQTDEEPFLLTRRNERHP